MSKTLNASAIAACIDTRSSALILDIIAKKLVYKPEIGASNGNSKSVEVDENEGTPSLVSCGPSLSYALNCDLPLLIQLSNPKTTANLDESIGWTSDLDESVRSDNLPIDDALGLYGTDQSNIKPGYNLLDSAASRMDVGGGPGIDTMRRTFFLASLPTEPESSGLVPVIELNRFFKYLPNDQITHIDCSTSGDVVIFVTASNVFTLTISGKPIARAPLPSPAKHFELIPSEKSLSEGYVAISSEDENVRIYSFPRLELLSQTSFGCALSMSMSFVGNRPSQSLLIFHSGEIGGNRQQLETHAHAAIGDFSIVDLSRLSHSAAQESTLGEAVQSAMNSRKNDSQGASGAESLAKALEGRLQASKASLTEVQERLEDKKAILSRSISILSRLSIDTSPIPSQAQPLDIPFAIEHDLLPIIGPSTRPAPQIVDSSPDSVLQDRVEASLGRLVFSNSHYLLQFTMTNHSSSRVARARNVVANTDGALCHSVLLHAPEVPPKASGIVSATIELGGDAALSPYVDVSFLLEIGWREVNPPNLTSAPMQAFLEKHSPSEPEWKTDLMSLGRTKIDAYPANAFSGLALRPILTLPLSPHSASLIATSDLVSTEAPVQDFLSSRLKQTDTFGNAFHNSNTGLIVKTYTHGGSVCIEIGAMESEDEILRLIQALYRYFDGLQIDHGRNSSAFSGEEDRGSALKVAENKLTPKWVSLCKRLVTCLKHEIQLSICMKQLLAESPSPDQAFFAWKRQFAEAQSATDLAVASLDT